MDPKATPWAYFDGAIQGKPPLGGSRGVLYLTKNDKLQIKFASGHCTNSKAELAAIHSVLELVVNRNITSLHIYGDSKMVVDWVNNKIKIKAPHIQQLLRVISRHLVTTSVFSITHICRELNTEADKLSKNTVLLVPSQTKVEETREG